MRYSPAQQRHNRRILWASAAYAALLFPAVYLFAHHLVAGPIAYVVGVLPGLAVSSFFWIIARYLVEETDEYLRVLQVRQLLVATGLALTGATIWGFLEGFDLVPHLLAYTWPIFWFGGLGLGTCINKLIERRAA